MFKELIEASLEERKNKPWEHARGDLDAAMRVLDVAVNEVSKGKFGVALLPSGSAKKTQEIIWYSLVLVDEKRTNVKATLDTLGLRENGFYPILFLFGTQPVPLETNEALLERLKAHCKAVLGPLITGLAQN